jgi:hypothetical protein
MENPKRERMSLICSVLQGPGTLALSPRMVETGSICMTVGDSILDWFDECQKLIPNFWKFHITKWYTNQILGGYLIREFYFKRAISQPI